MPKTRKVEDFSRRSSRPDHHAENSSAAVGPMTSAVRMASPAPRVFFATYSLRMKTPSTAPSRTVERNHARCV